MNVSWLEFNFQDFEFVTLLQYTAKTFPWYLILRKQFVHEIRKITPMRNLRLLQHSGYAVPFRIFQVVRYPIQCYVGLPKLLVCESSCHANNDIGYRRQAATHHTI